MNKVAAGMAAGLVATVPMTLLMLAMYRRLPREEQYPLPPAEITGEVAERVGVDVEALDQTERIELTLAAHLGYGAGTGALYGAISDSIPGPAPVTGAVYGLAVWAASYLGWLPAARILKPATEHPARRNVLMIASHLVWGAACGALTALWGETSPRHKPPRQRP